MEDQGGRIVREVSIDASWWFFDRLKLNRSLDISRLGLTISMSQVFWNIISGSEPYCLKSRFQWIRVSMVDESLVVRTS